MRADTERLYQLHQVDMSGTVEPMTEATEASVSPSTELDGDIKRRRTMDVTFARARSLAIGAVVAMLTVDCGSDSTSEPAASQPATTSGASVDAGEPPAAGSLPERDPDVTGVVGAGPGAQVGTLVEASDSYFEGMGLRLSGREPLVVGADGQKLTVDDVDDGDRVAVWVAGGCAESFPVQCDVVAIEVTSKES